MTPEIDFSFLALFARATLTVKLVIIMLIIAFFWLFFLCWSSFNDSDNRFI